MTRITTRRALRSAFRALSLGSIAICVLQNLGLLATLVDDVPASIKTARRREWLEDTEAHARLASERERERIANSSKVAYIPYTKQQKRVCASSARVW